MSAALTRKLLAKVPRENLIALIEPAKLDELLEQLADGFVYEPGGIVAAVAPAAASDEPSRAPAADLTADDLEPEDELAQVYGALLDSKAQTSAEVARFLGAEVGAVARLLIELVETGCVDRTPQGYLKSADHTLAEVRRNPLPRCATGPDASQEEDEPARVSTRLAHASEGIAPSSPKPASKKASTPASDAEEELARAYDALTSEPRPFAAILRQLGWAKPVLLRALERLEQIGVVVLNDAGWKWHPVRTLSVARTEPLPGSADDRTAACFDNAFDALLPGESRLASDLAHELDWTWRLVMDVLGDLKVAGKVATKVRGNKVYYERAESKPSKTGAQAEDAIFKVLAEKKGPLSFDAIARFAGLAVGPVAALMSRFLREGYVTQGAGGVTITRAGLDAWEIIQAADEVAVEVGPGEAVARERLLPMLAATGGRSIPELAAELGVGVDAVRRPLAELMHLGKAFTYGGTGTKERFGMMRARGQAPAIDAILDALEHAATTVNMPVSARWLGAAIGGAVCPGSLGSAKWATAMKAVSDEEVERVTSEVDYLVGTGEVLAELDGGRATYRLRRLDDPPANIENPSKTPKASKSTRKANHAGRARQQTAECTLTENEVRQLRAGILAALEKIAPSGYALSGLAKELTLYPASAVLELVDLLVTEGLAAASDDEGPETIYRLASALAGKPESKPKPSVRRPKKGEQLTVPGA